MSMYQFNYDLEFIKKTSSSDLANNHLKLVFDTYYKIFKEVCTNCPSKIGGYISKLKSQSNIIMEKDTRKFRLKKGSIIPISGTSIVYSDSNITDEIALQILKENPNRKSIFLKVPTNLEELLLEETDFEKVIINEIEYSINDALEILEKAGIKTKATTAFGVQKKVEESLEKGVEFELE